MYTTPYFEQIEFIIISHTRDVSGLQSLVLGTVNSKSHNNILTKLTLGAHHVHQIWYLLCLFLIFLTDPGATSLVACLKQQKIQYILIGAVIGLLVITLIGVIGGLFCVGLYLRRSSRLIPDSTTEH